MTCIILVYYIFTSDITYLGFAAVARCSIPVEILEKPPAFLSDLLPNFLQQNRIFPQKCRIFLQTFFCFKV